jgi:quinol monooxygenase YgiN
LAYVRLSVVKPLRGQEQHVEDVMRRLAEAGSQQPGCIASYVLRPHDDSGEVARLAIYEDEASAERAANTDHILALRSELHLSVQPGHQERAFFTD